MPESSSPGSVQERLREYGLRRFVESLPEAPSFTRTIHFDPGREETKRFYVRAPVRSLAELKLWAGLPTSTSMVDGIANI
jgi:hypothetical protein